MIRAIVTGENPQLRLVAKPVGDQEYTHQDFQDLIDDLFATMQQADGLGLAAPQVGVGKRLIIVTLGGQAECLINPRIIDASSDKVLSEEGCLSFPGLFGRVARHRKIRIQAHDRHGHLIERDLADLDARVVQHEIDHLDGILLTDRLDTTSDMPLEVSTGPTL